MVRGLVGDTGHQVSAEQIDAEEHRGVSLLCFRVGDEKGFGNTALRGVGFIPGSPNNRCKSQRRGSAEERGLLEGTQQEGQCEQQRAQERALYPEGNREPWKVVDQTVTRS